MAKIYLVHGPEILTDEHEFLHNLLTFLPFGMKFTSYSQSISILVVVFMGCTKMRCGEKHQKREVLSLPSEKPDKCSIGGLWTPVLAPGRKRICPLHIVCYRLLPAEALLPEEDTCVHFVRGSERDEGLALAQYCIPHLQLVRYYDYVNTLGRVEEDPAELEPEVEGKFDLLRSSTIGGTFARRETNSASGVIWNLNTPSQTCSLCKV